jgi:hypothetical protein
MYRVALFALALQMGGLCLAGQPIGILFDFVNQPDPAVVELMKSEIREILAPAELELRFQRISETGASQSFRKVVVVHFHGTCETRSDAIGFSLADAGLLDFPALGTTDVAAGRILPYVQVYCNEVRAFVPSPSMLPFAQLYGRALGRVVAHELYHVLLSTRDHSRTGVARFAQTARDLTRDKLALDLRSVVRLRELYGPKENEGSLVEPPSHSGPVIANSVSQLVHQP